MGGFVGPWEVILLALVLLLIFGPKRVPEIGRSIGKGMREFKDSISGEDGTSEQASLPAPSETAPRRPAREHDTL